MANMIAILGPSGVGKSCVCHGLVKDHSFLHVDFDGNQPWESNGFPAEWDQDISKVDFSLVATSVQGRIVAGQHGAAVLSFATIHLFTPQQLADASAVGITPIVLWGTQDQCIASRAVRAKKHRVRFNEQDRTKYKDKNRPAFELFAGEAYAPYRVEAFQPGGARWPADYLPRVCRERMTG